MRFIRLLTGCWTAPGIIFLWLSVAMAGTAEELSLDDLARAGHWKQIRLVVSQRTGTDTATLYWRSRIKQAFGELDAAETLAKQVVATDRTQASYHQALSSISLEQLSNRPGMVRTMRLARDVKGELEAALAIEPKNIDALRALMEFLWSAPAIGGGDRKRARELADEIARADALQGLLAQARMSELASGTELPKAEGLFRKAVQTAPKDYKARCLLAEFYLNANNWPAAAQEAKAAIALAPEQARGYTTLATALAHQGKGSELDECLEKAQKAVPDDWNPTFQAGKALMLDGNDLDRAERYLQTYLKQEPEGRTPTWGAAHWRLGLLSEKRGNKQKAVEELETAIRLQPSLAGAKKDLDRLK